MRPAKADLKAVKWAAGIKDTKPRRPEQQHPDCARRANAARRLLRFVQHEWATLPCSPLGWAAVAARGGPGT